MATDDDTELGTLLREAVARVGSVFFSASRHKRGLYNCMLSDSCEQDAPGGSTVVASVHAHGEGTTVLEAIRDALGKLPSKHTSMPRQRERTLGERTLADVTPRKAAAGER